MVFKDYFIASVVILILLGCVVFIIHLVKSDDGNDNFEEYLNRHQNKRD